MTLPSNVNILVCVGTFSLPLSMTTHKIMYSYAQEDTNALTATVYAIGPANHEAKSQTIALLIVCVFVHGNNKMHHDILITRT